MDQLDAFVERRFLEIHRWVLLPDEHCISEREWLKNGAPQTRRAGPSSWRKRTLQMRAPKSTGLKKGDQAVFAYGPHSDQTLFSEYGFVPSDGQNPWNEIRLDDHINAAWREFDGIKVNLQATFAPTPIRDSLEVSIDSQDLALQRNHRGIIKLSPCCVDVLAATTRYTPRHLRHILRIVSSSLCD
jgi:hypothetical protein